MKSRNQGFTLIELLVVIAIIAILAAILFPVFATAREKARQSACLNNVKQLGASLVMYSQDYDERLPSIWTLQNGGGIFSYTDVFGVMKPYIKNTDIFYCPDRTQLNCTKDANFSSLAERCYGYGYNWGPAQEFATNGYEGGLIRDEIGSYLPDGTVLGTFQGVQLSTILAPANTFAYGDSYDRPDYSIASTDILSEYSAKNGYAEKTNYALPHHGLLNIAYADGHAKASAWRAGDTKDAVSPNGKAALPKNPDQWQYWCANPDTVIDTYYYGSKRCGDMGAFEQSKMRYYSDQN